MWWYLAPSTGPLEQVVVFLEFMSAPRGGPTALPFSQRTAASSPTVGDGRSALRTPSAQPLAGGRLARGLQFPAP
jgi:hypothetical protein